MLVINLLTPVKNIFIDYFTRVLLSYRFLQIICYGVGCLIIPGGRLKREPCVNHGLTGNCKLSEWKVAMLHAELRIPITKLILQWPLPMTGESRIGGKVSAIQQARRPAGNKRMFGTFPIRYRQMIKASAFYAKLLELAPDKSRDWNIYCRACII